MSSPIDRRNPLPLYYQLKEALVGEIRDNALRPGDRLPSESEIEERFGVSRATIRQALNQLVNEGLVERIQGKGTYVAKPKIRHVPILTSFTENMRSQGYRPSRKVLVSVVASPPDEVADRLELPPDSRCRFLRRLLLADADPVGMAETWLPVDVLGGIDELFDPTRLESGSLYDLLQSPAIGITLHRGVETVYPGLADAEQAELLGCEEGSPVLLVERVTHTPDERAIEFTRMVFVGSRYEYRAEMYRP